MMTRAYALFATPIGACALAWGRDGIIGVQLPQATDPALRARLVQVNPGAIEASPPPDVAAVAHLIIGLLNGEPNDLAEAVLDMHGLPEFDRAAYAVLRTVLPGSTITYREIAARIGDANGARAVGRAMGANPFPIIVPCHRVIGADGKLGGFSANGGVITKAKLLSIERARIDEAPLLFEELPITVRSPTAR